MSPEERQEFESAIATGSPRRLYFLLSGWVDSGRYRQKRFLTALQNFWLQYLQ
jgi:hypothetical protein